jgi:hypothetical protein
MALPTMNYVFCLICAIISLSMLTPQGATAETYHVAPNGSDSKSGSIDAPWATFGHAMTNLQPGDTLVIKEGTYHQSLNVKVSGTPDKPITIKAEHDGKVIVDGEGKLQPFFIDGRHDMVVEGIVFKNSNKSVVQLNDTDRIIMRRISAYDANPDGNYALFQPIEVTDSLFEDIAVAGHARSSITLYKCNNVIMRRGYSRISKKNDHPGRMGIQTYGTSNSIVENFVGTKEPGLNIVALAGLNIWANVNQTASHNTITGSIIYDLDNPNGNIESYCFKMASKHRQQTGNRFINNVGINNRIGVQWCGDDGVKFDRMTLVDISDTVFFYGEGESAGNPKDPGYISRADIRNSIFVSSKKGFDNTGWRVTDGSYFGGLTHEFNVLFQVDTPYIKATKGTGEISIAPQFNTAKYGKGAYLIAPKVLSDKGENGTQMGAQILYRCVNGKLTNEPLWPWPMEGRIKNELGVSVTWEANEGLWRTLDGVYDEIPSDKTPPAAPTGLSMEGVK